MDNSVKQGLPLTLDCLWS